ncbi:hypothetical protein BDQ12DRAFT_763607 [Crucibulum laeve]|uniref:Uncharacterized protein n=1 Tax=Crucibulum laeve TaxID=68775 RepID=A0A5C3LP10_9AGAR|nr:hypothetical protein BDQ12DRAFT_763607 [Crucibulum laeve]
MALSINGAHLWGLFVQSVCFGLYLVTVGYTVPPLLRVGTRFRRAREINWPMLIGATILCVFITFGMILTFYHSLLAFDTGGPDNATRVYTDISSWINVTKLVNVLTQTVVGDVLLIYRCWVVNNRSWLSISVPILLWLGCIVCEIRILFLQATLHASALFSNKATFPYHASFWGISVTLNIMTTTLLIRRIWKIDREASKYRTNQSVKYESRLRHVMRIVLESGMIYTFSALLTFLTEITKSTASYPVSALTISAVGVAFNLIIIRSSVHEKNLNSTSASNGTIPLQFTSHRQAGGASIIPHDAKVRSVATEDTYYDSEANSGKPAMSPSRAFD